MDQKASLTDIRRKATRAIFIGPVQIGGGAPVVVQSMTNTDTRRVGPTLAQIERLALAGCEVARLAVPDQKAVAAFKEIKAESPLPLIADIHFNHRLALASLAAGADAIRINPGNLGGETKTRLVVEACRERGVPLRLGVNAGSLEADLLEKYGAPTAEALAASALRWVRKFEDWGFYDFKISLKSSDVLVTVAAYQELSRQTDYPLHLGVTEAGGLIAGTVKSALGIGLLLALGIGDTMRVSLTRDPVEEVRVAYEILRALHLRERGVELISCPTCGRLPHRPVQPGGRGGAPAAGRHHPPQGGHHGLRGERARRSPGGRRRHRWRRPGGGPVQKGPGGAQGAGKRAAGRPALRSGGPHRGSGGLAGGVTAYKPFKNLSPQKNIVLREAKNLLDSGTWDSQLH